MTQEPCESHNKLMKDDKRQEVLVPSLSMSACLVMAAYKPALPKLRLCFWQPMLAPKEQVLAVETALANRINQ